MLSTGIFYVIQSFATYLHVKGFLKPSENFRRLYDPILNNHILRL
jgi:hypothetical protein